MSDELNKRLQFWLGVACLVASVTVLFYQQELGAILGVWVMGLWLILGALGVYFMGKAKGVEDFNP